MVSTRAQRPAAAEVTISPFDGAEDETATATGEYLYDLQDLRHFPVQAAWCHCLVLIFLGSSSYVQS